MTEALRDRRTGWVLPAAMAASGAAWWLLAAGPPMGQIFVCGVDGYGPAGGAWNAGRLFSLSGMWLVMTIAMMLPVGVLSLLRQRQRDAAHSPLFCRTSPQQGGREDGASSRLFSTPAFSATVVWGGEHASGHPRHHWQDYRTWVADVLASGSGIRRYAPPSPRWGEETAQPSIADEIHMQSPRGMLTGYLSFLIAVSMVTATTQWMLESLGVVGEGGKIVSPVVAGALLAGIGIWHIGEVFRQRKPCGFRNGIIGTPLVHGWRHGCSTLGCCLTMIGLQLVGGAMNIALMIVLTAWMLAESILPWKRELACFTGIALLTAGALAVMGALA